MISTVAFFDTFDSRMNSRLLETIVSGKLLEEAFANAAVVAVMFGPTTFLFVFVVKSIIDVYWPVPVQESELET